MLIDLHRKHNFYETWTTSLNSMTSSQLLQKKTLNQTIPIYILYHILYLYIYTAYINPEKISASFPFHIAVSDLPLVPFAASLLISKRRSSSGRPARLWHFCSRAIILGARKTDVDWNKTC